MLSIVRVSGQTCMSKVGNILPTETNVKHRTTFLMINTNNGHKLGKDLETKRMGPNWGVRRGCPKI